jgi:glycosyltransferase involved in cell wall biosynthesis
MIISLIIPAYNAQATIGETLASVRAQTRQPDEIILIDDGSTDGTAQHQALKSPDVRVIRQPNAGAAAALNRGLLEAQGDIISFLDADDTWTAEKLALQAHFLKTNPDIGGVLGHFVSFACPTAGDEERARWRISDEPEPAWLLGALLIHKSALKGVGPFPENLRAGYSIDWIARLREAGVCFHVLPQTVLKRRIHTGSLAQPSAERDEGLMGAVRLALERKRRATQ